MNHAISVLLAGLALVASIQLGVASVDEQERWTFPVSSDSAVSLELDAHQISQPLNELLQVFVGSPDDCCQGRRAISGNYTLTGNTLTFTPSFGFIEGQAYTVYLSSPRQVVGDSCGQSCVLREFVLEPSTEKIVARVAAVLPSGPVIPENTLRFYVYFTVPMAANRSVEFIDLVDSAGRVDSEAFMSFKQELWSEDRKRLTVLMDPGRIKRGVAQHERLGPALEEGQSYLFVVKGNWPSANGKQVTPRYEQPFKVASALRTVPEVANWRVDAPSEKSRQPLTIRFDRPFDFESVKSHLAVFTEDGTEVVGEASLTQQEQLWQFVPANPWNGTQVLLSVDKRLEDVAGNNLHELLDRPPGAKAIPENDQSETDVLIVPLNPAN